MSRKRILILFQFDENKHLLTKLCKELNDFDFDADLFNMRTFSYSGKVNSKLKLLQLIIRIPKFKVIIYKLFRKKIILDISQQYDLIDIHFFSTIYDEIIPCFKKPIKVVFWGSDIYRIPIERLNNLNNLLLKVKSVQFLTPEMKSYVSKSSFNHKNIFTQPFGVVHFEKIRNLKNISQTADLKSTLGLNPKKIQISIGYNGSQNQQHIEIIDQITKIPEEVKIKTELIFLMTYGGNQTYIDRVENKLKKSNFDYQIVTKHLTEAQICMFRIASDITLNFQTTDGFSASIQEHFFAGNVMLLANWLPYEWLREKGLYFNSSSFGELNQKLENIILNFEAEKKLSSTNIQKIELISDWKSVAKNWSEIYKQTIEN